LSTANTHLRLTPIFSDMNFAPFVHVHFGSLLLGL
jgi:hypothetical protein